MIHMTKQVQNKKMTVRLKTGKEFTMMEIHSVLNRTFEADDDTKLTVEEQEHIERVLTSIQQPLCYINIRQGTSAGTDEKDVPTKLGCTLISEKHSPDGESVAFILQKGDVAFGLFRNGLSNPYHFSSSMEPYIVSAKEVAKAA